MDTFLVNFVNKCINCAAPLPSLFFTYIMHLDPSTVIEERQHKNHIEQLKTNHLNWIKFKISVVLLACKTVTMGLSGNIE